MKRCDALVAYCFSSPTTCSLTKEGRCYKLMSGARVYRFQGSGTKKSRYYKLSMRLARVIMPTRQTALARRLLPLLLVIGGKIQSGRTKEAQHRAQYGYGGRQRALCDPLQKEEPRSSQGSVQEARVGPSRLLGRLVPAGAGSHRRPLVNAVLVLFNSADCYERGRCVPAIVGVRVAPAHDEPRNELNSTERESTSGRSTNSGSAHLIRVFHDIGRTVSLLFLLTTRRPLVTQVEKGFRTGI